MITVKKTNESVTNLRNLVTVKTYNRHLIFLVKVNRSVSRCPVLIVLNCGIHLLFDLTHEVEKWCSFDSYKIHDSEGLSRYLVQLIKVVVSY